MLLKIYINYSHSKERTTNKAAGTYVKIWGRVPSNFGCSIILLIRWGKGVRLPPKISNVSTKVFDVPAPLRHNISQVQLLAMSIAFLQKRCKMVGVNVPIHNFKKSIKYVILKMYNTLSLVL